MLRLPCALHLPLLPAALPRLRSLPLNAAQAEKLRREESDAVDALMAAAGPEGSEAWARAQEEAVRLHAVAEDGVQRCQL